MSRSSQRNKKKHQCVLDRCEFLGIKAKSHGDRMAAFRGVVGNLTWPAYLTETKQKEKWEQFKKAKKAFRGKAQKVGDNSFKIAA